MVCSKCGAEIGANFKFCPQCGTPVPEEQKSKQEQTPAAEIMAVASSNVPQMVTIPGGSFIMGTNEFNRKVSLLGFMLSATPITQKQYEYIMGKNPSKLVGSDKPVECVNWCEALIFCNALSMEQHLVPCYSIGNATDLSAFESNSPLWKRVACNFTATGFRLPTEAEWEYAARGGKDSSPNEFAGSDDINETAWYGENSNVSTHKVSTKKPNNLGLYDMCGNVSEWCWDYLGELGAQPMTNPHGPKMGNLHVKRGGSWLDDAQQCSVFYRSGSPHTGKSSSLGFRVCQSTIESVM